VEPRSAAASARRVTCEENILKQWELGDVVVVCKYVAVKTVVEVDRSKRETLVSSMILNSE